MRKVQNKGTHSLHNVVFSRTTNEQTNKLIPTGFLKKTSTSLFAWLLYQCGPSSIAGPAFTCGLSLLSVLVLALRVFLVVLRCFLPPPKTNTSKFQFDRESEGHRFVSCKTIMCYPGKLKAIYLFLLHLKVKQIE